MSADNGIYIGKFPVQDSTVYECRVIEAQAIDNITWFPDEEHKQKFQGENPRAIVEYFGDAEVLTQAQAQTKAFAMEEEIKDSDYPVLEYGVCSLKFKKPFAFYKEHAKEIQYPWDKEDNDTSD